MSRNIGDRRRRLEDRLRRWQWSTVAVTLAMLGCLAATVSDRPDDLRGTSLVIADQDGTTRLQVTVSGPHVSLRMFEATGREVFVCTAGDEGAEVRTQGSGRSSIRLACVNEIGGVLVGGKDKFVVIQCGASAGPLLDARLEKGECQIGLERAAGSTRTEVRLLPEGAGGIFMRASDAGDVGLGLIGVDGTRVRYGISKESTPFLLAQDESGHPRLGVGVGAVARVVLSSERGEERAEVGEDAATGKGVVRPAVSRR